MRYINDVNAINQEKHTAVTLGKFDGIHKGHRKLLTLLGKLAEEEQLEKAVFTFNISPQARISHRKYRTLLTNEERRAMLEEMGMDLLVECRFNDAMRNMEAENFIRKIIVEGLKAKVVVAGTDFCFGKDRRGNGEMLLKMGKELGFETYILEKETADGHEISSTYIREKLEAGEMDTVNRLLTYDFFVTGPVLHGAALGRKLGFPTINQIPPDEKLLPPKGVYKSRTEIDGHVYESVTNIGTKPTVDGSFMGVETYIFDFDENVYGKEAKVYLLEHTRPEMKFSSLEELTAQLRIDSGDRLKEPVLD